MTGMVNDTGSNNGINGSRRGKKDGDPGQGTQQMVTSAGVRSSHPAGLSSPNKLGTTEYDLDTTISSPSHTDLGPPGLRVEGA